MSISRMSRGGDRRRRCYRRMRRGRAPIARSRVSANMLLGSKNAAAVWGRFVTSPAAHNLRHGQGIRELYHSDFRASHVPGRQGIKRSGSLAMLAAIRRASLAIPAVSLGIGIRRRNTNTPTVRAVKRPQCGLHAMAASMVMMDRTRFCDGRSFRLSGCTRRLFIRRRRNLTSWNGGRRNLIAWY